MTILFGHPGGNPNSHHAALAHLEAGWLEAFCVPWMPSDATLRILQCVGPLRGLAQRLARRHFPPLANAPKVQGRLEEWRRLLVRARGYGDESLSYKANDWLMRTMSRECRRRGVTAIHAYEDCSLWQFVEAKRLGKACIYDMPIGYYPAWRQIERELARKFSDWLPAGGLPSSRFTRPEQKRQEMELADLVLAPSGFVEKTVRAFHPAKKIARARYGVDTDFWTPGARPDGDGVLHVLYAGQLSLRKGIPDLIDAWRKAALRDAKLTLVGSWMLSERKLGSLPATVVHEPPCSPQILRDRYRAADVFVYPSYFEGLSLAIVEALSCGLPVIATEATGCAEIIDGESGQVIPAGDTDALVESLRWFGEHRDRLSRMSWAARQRAERMSWAQYRDDLSTAVAPFI